MTDATLQTPRRPGGFKFERYASAFLLLAAVLLYVGIFLIEGQTRYLSVDNLVSWFSQGKAITPVPETAGVKPR